MAKITKDRRLENIEIALLDIAVCIEFGKGEYDKLHPEGIYQCVAQTLFTKKTKKTKTNLANNEN